MSTLSLHNEETRERTDGSCDSAPIAGCFGGIPGNGGLAESLAGNNAGRLDAVSAATWKALSPYDQWEADFKPLLGDTGRWEGFSFIAKDQLERETIGIIETGTCRKPGDWKGDGQSTRVWDWIVAAKQGFGYSVDLDIAAVLSSQQLAPHMQVVCQDSISFLRGHIPFRPTLLYLDSFDYPEDLTVRVNACMHQVAELASIWGRLPSGCLIASDDSIDADNGKPAITRRILHALGIEPVLDSYVVVWKKP